MKREQLNLVVVGHVDHGKSTVIGRLLADTNSLPEGKLEQVKENCKRNSKPFEYAFLLDALQAEQSQGITIDTARSFFKSKMRDYIIIDAPGHIEFLKNMVTGAARAEAAILIIDAEEGVKENSRRHGYMLSMLGINQVIVCVNKMDLVDYSQKVYDAIKKEYTQFLSQVDIHPKDFFPLSAFYGENIITPSTKMPWYEGKDLLALVDTFEKEPSKANKPFRFPVQDVYKFTEFGDARRIVAGRVETGTIKTGEEVLFLPSGKQAKIASIEEFNHPVRKEISAGYSAGFTLTPEIYVKPGELMVKQKNSLPKVGSRIRVNIFWMGKRAMVQGKKYKLKIATAEVSVWLDEVTSVLDASELVSVANKKQVDQYDVGNCVLETFKPIAFDLVQHISATGRFVIVDDYEITGGGIILEGMGDENRLLQEHINKRNTGWKRSAITSEMRSSRYGQKSTFIVITGPGDTELTPLAKTLEEKLFKNSRFVYYLGLSNTLLGLSSDFSKSEDRSEFIRRLGEVSHLFTDAGTILITTVNDLDDYELNTLIALNSPGDFLLVNVGPNNFTSRKVDLQLDNIADITVEADKITKFLFYNNILVEYYL